MKLKKHGNWNWDTYYIDLVNVAVVNQPASFMLSGGKILNFWLEPLEDKSFISGECNNSCSKGPDGTFFSLLLLHTLASYLQKIKGNCSWKLGIAVKQ